MLISTSHVHPLPLETGIHFQERGAQISEMAGSLSGTGEADEDV